MIDLIGHVCVAATKDIQERYVFSTYFQMSLFLHKTYLKREKNTLILTLASYFFTFMKREIHTLKFLCFRFLKVFFKTGHEATLGHPVYETIKERKDQTVNK